MSETNDNNSFLLTKIHIMGYNNKNARNGKSISTIAKLQKVQIPQHQKSKLLRQPEHSKYLDDI